MKRNFTVNYVFKLTNGNLKNKTENTINKTKFSSYPLKLTATWDFI